jgi:hypothetical protein
VISAFIIDGGLAGKMERNAMVDQIDKIMSEIESDPTINAREISLIITSKGLLKKNRILNINGLVESDTEKNRVMEIVKKHAGHEYEVADRVIVL